jgi:hypothetical protein
LFGQADRDAIRGAAEQLAAVVDEKLTAQVEEINVELTVTIGKIAQHASDPILTDYAIGRLADVRTRHPDHRRAAIVLGTLYRKKGDLPAALDVLDKTLAAKAERGTGTDKDAQDIHFNRACYLYLQRHAAPDAEKPALNDKLYKALAAAFKDRPDNIEEARTDSELRNIQSEPQYTALIASLAPPAAGGT